MFSINQTLKLNREIAILENILINQFFESIYCKLSISLNQRVFRKCQNDWFGILKIVCIGIIGFV
jgi:hypothetical protein